MSILTLLLSGGGLALLVAGAVIQYRNRSPYAGTQLDGTEIKRLNAGAWISAVGALSIVAAQMVTFWL